MARRGGIPSYRHKPIRKVVRSDYAKKAKGRRKFAAAMSHRTKGHQSRRFF